MAQYFYNFCFQDKNHGYYYLEQTASTLFSETKFYLENAELYINTFQLELKNDKVTAYKYKDDEWVDLSLKPANYYPTSAYPLLLPKVSQRDYSYTAVSEHDNSLLGETLLSKEDNEIIETQAGKVVRRFTMKDDMAIKIDWGGPISYLCANASEAVKGTNLKMPPRAPTAS